MARRPKQPPGGEDFVHMAYAGEDGEIQVHPDLRMAAFDGRRIRPVRLSECIAVPQGSDFFTLPGRQPVGWDDATSEPVVLADDEEPLVGLSAFLAPAYLRLVHPAALRSEGAPTLPLYAYSAVGAAPDGTPVAPALRVDPDPRQDPPRFDMEKIEREAARISSELPGNRLVGHVRHCALVYGCRAAQNYFLGRWEAPIPIARACNARCVGCLSLQREPGKVASHDRIGFSVSPEEVAGLALDHLRRAPTGVVSFGQGCEGEPLLHAEVAAEAVRQVRSKTRAGTLHLNTNGSRPEAVDALVRAGLDSIRISLNSARPEVYDRYYRPQDYAFAEVLRSAEIALAAGRFVSLNLLVFPGVTDTAEELSALISLHKRAPFHMIQWRNLNVDPDEYLAALSDLPFSEPMGLDRFITEVEGALGVSRGYFNPPKERFER